MRLFVPALYFAGLASLHLAAAPAGALTPDDPGPADVAFTIDANGDTTAISPLIYGINGGTRFDGVTNIRMGGNRWTGYNWETNDSNAGEDYFNSSDQFLTGAYGQTTAPGQAVLPTLQEAANLGATTGVTVPIAGYVSADADGTVTAAQTAPSSRWHQVVHRKTDIYPGAAPSLTPNLNDNYVFTDEFVHWVENNRQNNQDVVYYLDNEPGLWDNTHPHLYGTTNPTFADVGQRTIASASAIKDTAPNAKVFGGVTFGWSGMQTLHDAADFDQQVASDGGRQLDKLQFNRWLLKELAAAEQQQGRVLMDVLDLHWYPEARGGGVRITTGGAAGTTPDVVAARVQAPRSLWDPDYIEDSWIANDILRDYSGQGNHQGIELLNRVHDDIDELKPGTLVSVSEYNYGGGDHISGAIAQADVLGVFGRENVYSAAWWPLESSAPYVEAAFEIFTDFDGQGGAFGDLSVHADTDDIESSAIHASRSSDNPNELTLVAINRTDAALDAAIQINDDQRYTAAEVFLLDGDSATITATGSFTVDLLNAFLYEMPAFSVTAIRLTAEEVQALTGDYNASGQVEQADLDLVLQNWGTDTDPTSGAGVPTGWTNDLPEGLIDQSELDGVLLNWGSASAPVIENTIVPEPGVALLALVTTGVASRRFRRTPGRPGVENVTSA